MSSRTKKINLQDEAFVFDFLNPKGNDKISKMRGIDLQDLIVLIDDYYIKLRNKLGLEQYITFGLELEFEHAKRGIINKKLREIFPNNNWRTKDDGSLQNGAEISSPVLQDKLEDWNKFKKVCNIVNHFASIDIHSGGHIHIGTQALGDKKESWLNFLKMWSVYENIIFRFSYGEFLTARPSIQKYAIPMAKIFWEIYQNLKLKNASLESIIKKIQDDRYCAVNFENVDYFSSNKYAFMNTIEFRCPNGSLNPIIWQNNVNFFVKMLLYCKSISFDDDIIENRYRLLNFNKYFALQYYDEIYLQQALELCDMIFNNNLDKINFLKQYLKSFKIYEQDEEYPRVYQLNKRR